MEQKQILALVILVVVGIGGYLLFGNNKQVDIAQQPKVGSDTSESPDITISSNENSNTDGATVTYTRAGYSPETITVDSGTTVTFINESDLPMWVATDVHPVHAEYPGSSISKCGTDEESEIFDACRGVDTGGSYSFEFNESGTWEYHDHLNPSRTGTIIVE